MRRQCLFSVLGEARGAAGFEEEVEEEEEEEEKEESPPILCFVMYLFQAD
jgi:hypothetical protein